MDWQMERTRENEVLVRMQTPEAFRFAEAEVYLARSPKEILFRVQDGEIARLVRLGSDTVLLRISSPDPGWLSMTIESDHASDHVQAAVEYLWDWFDLHRDLTPFYKLAGQDNLLGPIVDAYYGLRLIGVADLFEALTWAVIGQQINLGFAYTLKHRFVETYGTCMKRGGTTYWLFPEASRIAALTIADLQSLQMTARKSEYIIGIASLLASGELSKAVLMEQGAAAAKRTLTGIRGIGDWTANYVAMRCLRDASAYPVADVGLQNAVKQGLGLDRKPTQDELLALAKPWSGWEAYATFYLWRSLQGLSA